MAHSQYQSTAASSIAEVSCAIPNSPADTDQNHKQQHLSTPSTLTRIPLLRERIQKERASLQASLSARAKEQVDSVREGLQGLKQVSIPLFLYPTSY